MAIAAIEVKKIFLHYFSRKESHLGLPNEDMVGASPNLAKVLDDGPGLLDLNRSDLLYASLLKYYTFQAVVWSLEGDKKTLNNYFNKVLSEINKASTKTKIRTSMSMMTCLKWFFESFVILDEFDKCHQVLISMKDILLIKVRTFINYVPIYIMHSYDVVRVI